MARTESVDEIKKSKRRHNNQNFWRNVITTPASKCESPNVDRCKIPKYRIYLSIIHVEVGMMVGMEPGLDNNLFLRQGPIDDIKKCQPNGPF